MFGDPCPGTHKYLEAHYQCISIIQTSTTTTNRPSPPPWVLNQPPPILPNIIGSFNSSYVKPGLLPPPVVPQRIPPHSNVGNGPRIWDAVPASPTPSTTISVPPLFHSVYHNTSNVRGGSLRHDSVPPPPPPPIQKHHNTELSSSLSSSEENNFKFHNAPHLTTVTPTSIQPATVITGGVTGLNGENSILTTKTLQNHYQQKLQFGTTLPTSVSSISTEANRNHNQYNGGSTAITRSNNGVYLNSNLNGNDESNMFCGPVNARNLFWNITKVGDVNVQPCPGGAAGIAKWRCVLMKRFIDADEDLESTTTVKPCLNNTNCTVPPVINRLRIFEPTWHPLTPDLTQCRSLWLNNLEMRVNQRDSSLISIANDLSEVTNSKTLYGGDMLVTTKIIQTMSEKMFHDKETFPDQRQREAIILELLNGVVKTGSNLLDESQLPSWLDMNQEDQMRVATSLLTGLEYNAFLLADTIIREANIIQKVKNICKHTSHNLTINLHFYFILFLLLCFSTFCQSSRNEKYY